MLTWERKALLKYVSVCSLEEAESTPDNSPALSQLRGFILCLCICFWNTETAFTTTQVGQEEWVRTNV